ncbi:MAG: hypothetical protein OD814_000943 [Candidatus Alkanophagales archaeon MCA70_species_1]|nr:hypothetical protein [Candidatus Alkanophaga volatiphilum]
MGEEKDKEEGVSIEDIVELLEKYGEVELRDVKVKGTVELELG